MSSLRRPIIATPSADSTRPVHQVGAFLVLVSEAPDEPDWDDFLEQAPTGHHAQTSCWGRARASIDWVPIRAIVTEDGRVVGGVQMVTRPMPGGGQVGFVHRGPAVAPDRRDLVDLVFSEMLELGRAHGVRYLVVQPPPGADWMMDELRRAGFRYGAFDIDHTSTVRIDMTPSLDELMTALRKHTRKHVRLGQRSGITVRRGSEDDIAIFNRLKDIHSARLGYRRRDDAYYEALWRALAPRGLLNLFIAEYKGEPVSAQLAVTFGDTCRHMERPWSGEHAKLRPNELLKWEVISWAKTEGYRFTDLEGIEPPLARAHLAGEALPDDEKYSASFFKLKFVPPGEVIIDPPSFDYFYNPVLRFIYRCIPTSVMRSERMREFLFKFRETGS